LTPERIRNGWEFSVSYTTRDRRQDEQDGREYHFVTDEQFNRMVDKGLFAEHFQVHLYKYGTPRQPLERIRSAGGIILLDVDVQGARKLKEVYPSAVSIFIQPPSLDALKERLKKRGTETEEQLRVRFENASKEMEDHEQFDYVVINEELDRAVARVLGIIEEAT
jgi:guanylate kinase